MDAEAFSPGHITGFFEVVHSQDLLSTGSRGAGLCLALGARSRVTVGHAIRQTVSIAINGKRADAAVTRSALKHLLGKEKLRVKVETVLDLPQSQGFGMSAAGALSASLALARILAKDEHEAFEAAHMAEVQNKTGLGDVSAVHQSGITIRTMPGLPPIGRVERIDGAPEVVLVVIGPRISTKDILTDPAKIAAINKSGSQKAGQLLREPTLSRFMELSAQFAIETGLAQKEVLSAMNAASKLGSASMAMLGNSVFAVGDVEGLVRVLSGFGEVWVTKVDTRGARVLSYHS
jgi:pantoate kinase